MPVPGGVQGGQNPTQGLVHWMSAVMAEHMTSNTHHDPAVGMHYMWNGTMEVRKEILKKFSNNFSSSDAKMKFLSRIMYVQFCGISGKLYTRSALHTWMRELNMKNHDTWSGVKNSFFSESVLANIKKWKQEKNCDWKINKKQTNNIKITWTSYTHTILVFLTDFFYSIKNFL